MHTYILKIYDKIDDPELVHGWNNISYAYDYFPQSSYDWCATWWKRMAGSLELHVVAVLDESGYIVGIAPLCIERRIGMRSLRSFPIHFADFYTFIICRDKRYEEVIEYLGEYVQSFGRWDIVRLEQLNSDDRTCQLLRSRGFSPKKLTEIVVADFEGKSFDEYLQKFSVNSRKDLKKNARRLERDHQKIELVKIKDYDGYSSYFKVMKILYDARWSDDIVVLNNRYYECKNEALRACFNDGKMLLYLLMADNNVIAYQLGFVVDRTFYTWNESHNPAYANYSPGQLIKYYFIKDLIQCGFSKVNFMAGDYDFKRSFAKDSRMTTNYLFLSSKHSLRGWILFRYYLHWRDIVKRQYHKLIAYSWVKNIVTKRHKRANPTSVGKKKR